MNKIITTTLKLLLPNNFYVRLRAAYLKLKKTPPYVKGIYDFDLFFLKSGATAIDVGANIG